MEREEIDYSEDSRLRILFLIPGPALETPPRFHRRWPFPFSTKPALLGSPVKRKIRSVWTSGLPKKAGMFLSSTADICQQAFC
jgi:hypothetical protein